MSVDADIGSRILDYPLQFLRVNWLVQNASAFRRLILARWPLRQRLWVRLKGFLDLRDRPFQLRIAALDRIGRVVFNLDVGVDPMPFDHILAFRVGRSEFR